MPVVIVNPSTPIGPRDIKPTPTGRMIVDAAAGRMPAYVDTGLNVVHVDDVAEGHLLAFERGVIGERYILGGENMTLRAILIAIAGIAGRRPPRFRLPHNLHLCRSPSRRKAGAGLGRPRALVTVGQHPHGQEEDVFLGRKGPAGARLRAAARRRGTP